MLATSVGAPPARREKERCSRCISRMHNPTRQLPFVKQIVKIGRMAWPETKHSRPEAKTWQYSARFKHVSRSNTCTRYSYGDSHFCDCAGSWRPRSNVSASQHARSYANRSASASACRGVSLRSCGAAGLSVPARTALLGTLVRSIACAFAPTANTVTIKRFPGCSVRRASGC